MLPEFSAKRATSFNELIRTSTEKNEILNDLEDFIAILNSQNITPILITTPCFEPYVKVLDREQLKKNEADILTLAKKFNLSYWNYLELPLPKEAFFNRDHLNREGAKMFAAILNKKIIDEVRMQNLKG